MARSVSHRRAISIDGAANADRCPLCSYIEVLLIEYRHRLAGKCLCCRGWSYYTGLNMKPIVRDVMETFTQARENYHNQPLDCQPWNFYAWSHLKMLFSSDTARLFATIFFLKLCSKPAIKRLKFLVKIPKGLSQTQHCSSSKEHHEWCVGLAELLWAVRHPMELGALDKVEGISNSSK